MYTRKQKQKVAELKLRNSLHILKNGESLLHEAVRKDDVAQAKELIAAGVDINFQDCAGNSSIHIAANNNSIACLRVLLEAKADLNNTEIKSDMIDIIGNIERSTLSAAQQKELTQKHSLMLDDEFSAVDYAVIGESFAAATLLLSQDIIPLNALRFLEFLIASDFNKIDIELCLGLFLQQQINLREIPSGNKKQQLEEKDYNRLITLHDRLIPAAKLKEKKDNFLLFVTEATKYYLPTNVAEIIYSYQNPYLFFSLPHKANSYSVAEIKKTMRAILNIMLKDYSIETAKSLLKHCSGIVEEANNIEILQDVFKLIALISLQHRTWGMSNNTNLGEKFNHLINMKEYSNVQIFISLASKKVSYHDLFEFALPKGKDQHYFSYKNHLANFESLEKQIETLKIKASESSTYKLK